MAIVNRKRKTQATTKVTYKKPRMSMYKSPSINFTSLKEDKLSDRTSTSLVNAIDSSVAALPLCAIAQGTDNTNRIGRVVKLSSVSLRYSVSLYSVDYSVRPAPTRVILFVDYAVNGTTPTWTDIMSDNTQPFSHANLGKKGRFRILRNDVFTMPFVSAETGNVHTSEPSVVTREHYVKLDHPMTFTGTGSTDADVDSGQVYLMHVTNCKDFSDTARSTWAINYNTRVRYQDA